MSQIHAVKASRQHPKARPILGLQKLDLFFAVLLHALVIIIIAVVAFWQQHDQVEPLKHIEIMIISAKQLAKMEQQAIHKTKPKSKSIPHTKIHHSKKKNIKQKKRVIHKIKPTQAKRKLIVKPSTVKKPIKRIVKQAKVEDDFDPFAPVTSTTDVTSPPQQAKTAQPELADIIGKQLSLSEKEHYIALMQTAVQQHWKIAVSNTTSIDPLVEMNLLPSGAIASVRILESSGNSSLDASLIRAIKAAAPFALPRQQFAFFSTNRIRFHPLK